KVTRNQAGEAAHDDEAGTRILFQYRERCAAIDAQKRGSFEAARARDARGIAVEQRRPAEHFAFLQHEAAGRGVIAAADEELDAAGLEHEEILRRIARTIKHRPSLVVLAPRQGSEFFQDGLLKSI